MSSATRMLGAILGGTGLRKQTTNSLAPPQPPAERKAAFVEVYTSNEKRIRMHDMSNYM